MENATPYRHEGRLSLAIAEGLATLRLEDDRRHNALRKRLLRELAPAFGSVDSTDLVRTVLLRGGARDFMVGADLPLFLRALRRRKLEPILAYVEEAHALFHRIDHSPRRVLIALEGRARGAGTELLLCADRVLALPSASLQLPETGIGIYPALGGTQRLPRRVGRALARWMILSGPVVSAERALRMGLVDEIVPSASALERRVAELHAASSWPPVAGPSLDPDLEGLQAFFEAAPLEALLAGRAPLSADMSAGEELRMALWRIPRRAPIACRHADALIDLAAAGREEEGLCEEIARLASIFETEDAWRGLSTVGRNPGFLGR